MTSTPRWVAIAIAVVVAAVSSGAAGRAQGQVPAGSDARGDWPLHSLDLHNSRYAPFDEIKTSNVGTVTEAWSFDAGVSLGQATPLVVDGVLYVNSGSQLFAVDGATGAQLWSTELELAFGPTGRGPAYGGGRIYAYGQTTLYAVDAASGEPVESFGTGGTLDVVNEALDFAYPDQYPGRVDPVSLGYFSLTTPPTYYDDTLFVGLAHGDSHIRGGLLAAVDGTTGRIKWTFNPVPQLPGDSGWDVAAPTWQGGARVGAGIWTPPAIDPELGLIYFNASNPSPDFDGSARLGENLFTNSTVAVHLETGELAWYYQTIHHDIWDWDHVSGPVLFDAQVHGETVKAIGVPGKTCYVYIWNRETGQPINPMIETPVPTYTDVPGDEVWPTQPIPYTSRGVPQEPFCAILPSVTDPELAERVRPFFHPYLVNEFVITSPGNTGGANYGPPSFSPRTGLVYVTGKNDAFSIKVQPVGDTVEPGVPAIGFTATIAERGETGMTASQVVAAYEPGTGELVWRTDMPNTTSTGNLVTAGDLVFQAVGNVLYALDARSGEQHARWELPRRTRASPMTYLAGGRQFVAIAVTNSVVAFAASVMG